MLLKLFNRLFNFVLPLAIVYISFLSTNQSFGQQMKFVQDNFSSRFPQTIVNDIFQDPNGLIWLGTSAGLYSYDGINYHILTESKTKQISNIFNYSEDEILVGTEDGKLIKVNFLKEQAQLVTIDSLIENSINGVITINNQLFAASYGDGLWKSEQGGWEKITGLSEFSFDEIYSMATDKDRRIYLGTDDGLCIFDYKKNQFDWITVKDGLPDNIVKVLQADKEGNIWIGFHQNGFCKIKDGQLSDEIFIKNWEYGPIISINTQLDNRLFIGTSTGALIDYQLNADKNKLILTSWNHSSIIKNILVDREANLWVSDANNGLSKSSLFFSYLDFPGPLSSQNVQSIFMDSRQNLWFSTADALYECTLSITYPNIKSISVPRFMALVLSVFMLKMT